MKLGTAGKDLATKMTGTKMFFNPSMIRRAECTFSSEKGATKEQFDAMAAGRAHSSKVATGWYDKTSAKTKTIKAKEARDEIGFEECFQDAADMLPPSPSKKDKMEVSEHEDDFESDEDDDPEEASARANVGDFIAGGPGPVQDDDYDHDQDDIVYSKSDSPFENLKKAKGKRGALPKTPKKRRRLVLQKTKKPATEESDSDGSVMMF